MNKQICTFVASILPNTKFGYFMANFIVLKSHRSCINLFEIFGAGKIWWQMIKALLYNHIQIQINSTIFMQRNQTEEIGGVRNQIL